MTKEERKIMYKYWSVLPQSFCNDIAKVSNKSIGGLYQFIEQELYLCSSMNEEMLEDFFCRISDMDEDEISLVEHVNHLPIHKIYKIYGGKKYVK